MVSQTNAQLVAGGSHGGDVFNGEANTTDAAKVSRVEVIAEPDRFDVSNVGTVEETLNLINPQNSGLDARRVGSGTGKPLYSQKQINAAIDNCAQSYFSVQLDSFDPTSRGHNGTFNGTDLNNSSNVTVVNDVHTFSMAQLGNLDRKFGGSGGPPIAGGTPIFRPDIQAAGYSPYRNYTGNDVRGSDPVVKGLSYREGTQIWELGNSLGQIKPHNRGPGGEPGPWFLNCVNAMLKAHIGGFN